MASLDEMILKSVNPFDSYRAVNFWHTQLDSEPIVESIHQSAILAIATILDQVAQDHRTRTVLLLGDAGSGKTYLLGRLKQTLNPKAFFAYIPPFPQSDQFWRHVLRYTVDSLVQVPEGQQDSQLLLWLKSLSVFKKRTWKDRWLKDSVLDLLQSDRQRFVKTLHSSYRQTGIANADHFFGVLYDLTNPDLYPLACSWLRGIDLSDESLEAIGVGQSITTEEAAYETLANFGRISTETQPIVLCFDQLESIAQLPDGNLNLQALFSANTKIHDEHRNFLVIISITTDTWRQNETRIDQSHKDRIDQQVSLKKINLEQAEALLASRLYPLHAQASPPPSGIAPFTRQQLEAEFPGYKTDPRNVLKFGRDLFQEYKQWLVGGRTEPFTVRATDDSGRPPVDLLAHFQLAWLGEFSKVQEQVLSLSQFSSAELIQMLLEALISLQAEEIKTPLLIKTRFVGYSLGFRRSPHAEQVGVVWAEDPNMTTFFHIMEACRKAVENHLCETLYLFRLEQVGQPNLRGNQLYRQIFTGSPHRHLEPSLLDVHALSTYYNLVKDAREGDLVVGGETINLKELRGLVRESAVLTDCRLLQALGVVGTQAASAQGNESSVPLRTPQAIEPTVQSEPAKSLSEESPDNGKFKQVESFLVNHVKTQPVMGLQLLTQTALKQFSPTSEAQITALIQQLCQQQQIKIMNPKAPIDSQIVCLIPPTK